MNDDGDFVTDGDEMSNRVVKGQPIRYVTTRAVDIDRDGFETFIREFAEAFDRLPSGLFFDVADQIDVTKPIGLFFFDKVFDSVDQFIEQTLA